VTNAEGAAALGLSDRQFRRLKAAYRARGDAAMAHGNRGKRSPRRLPDSERQQIVQCMFEKYPGLNDCHLTEKLCAEEHLSVSRELVRRLRIEAGEPAKRRRRAPKHHRRREREAREGALVLIDGSTHAWLESRGPVFTLVGAVDDASGRILTLVVREREDLHGYLELLRRVASEHGVPLAFYGDRFGALIRNDPHWTLEEELRGRQDPTTFGRILEELGVAFIAAGSPQAKGRIERLWGVLQDRLVAELRLLGVKTLDQVRAYLPHFIAEYNARFAKPVRDPRAAWRPGPRDLPLRLSCRYVRVVARDNTASIPGRWLQLPARSQNRSWQGCSVELRECLDGTFHALHRGRVIASQEVLAGPFTLVQREGGHRARRRTQNLAPPPQIEDTAPTPTRKRPQRLGNITNIRRPDPTHPWKRDRATPPPA